MVSSDFDRILQGKEELLVLCQQIVHAECLGNGSASAVEQRRISPVNKQRCLEKYDGTQKEEKRNERNIA